VSTHAIHKRHAQLNAVGRDAIKAIAKAIYEARRDDADMHWDGDITANIGAGCVSDAVRRALNHNLLGDDRERFHNACKTGRWALPASEPAR
jgi:hypothetical protein